MSTDHVQVEVSNVQDAICSVALSLDAFLVNGIQNGVLQRAVFGGFLQKTASNLLRDLDSLEELAPHAPCASGFSAISLLPLLRAKCQQLIGVVTGLSSFTAFSLEELRSTVSQVPLLREECVRLIQELEAGFRIPKPFYPSRPSRSAASVNDFLANLERTFLEARGSQEKEQGTDIPSSPFSNHVS